MPRTGEFQQTDFGFKGHLLTREGRFSVELHRTEGDDQDRPHYEAKAPNGADIGAAWDRIGEQSKEPYVRVSIDDMSMSQRIVGNLINEGNGTWVLISQRPLVAATPEND